MNDKEKEFTELKDTINGIKVDNYRIEVIRNLDIEQVILQQDHIDNVRSINDLKLSKRTKEYIELDKKYNLTRDQLDDFNRNLNSMITDKIKELQQKSVVDADTIIEIVSNALTSYKESEDVKEAVKVAFMEYYNHELTDKFPHNCYDKNCNTILIFSEAWNEAKNQFTLEQFIKIWCSPYVQLYCCKCYKANLYNNLYNEFYIRKSEIDKNLHELRKIRIKKLFAYNDGDQVSYEKLRRKEIELYQKIRKERTQIEASYLNQGAEIEYLIRRTKIELNQILEEQIEDHRITTLYRLKGWPISQIKEHYNKTSFKQIKDHLKAKRIKRSQSTKIKETIGQFFYFLQNSRASLHIKDPIKRRFLRLAFLCLFGIGYMIILFMIFSSEIQLFLYTQNKILFTNPLFSMIYWIFLVLTCLLLIPEGIEFYKERKKKRKRFEK